MADLADRRKSPVRFARNPFVGKYAVYQRQWPGDLEERGLVNNPHERDAVLIGELVAPRWNPELDATTAFWAPVDPSADAASRLVPGVVSGFTT